MCYSLLHINVIKRTPSKKRKTTTSDAALVQQEDTTDNRTDFGSPVQQVPYLICPLLS